MDELFQTQRCPHCTYHCLCPFQRSANSQPNYHGTSASWSGGWSNPSIAHTTRHSNGHDSFRCECRSNLHLYIWCTASSASPSGASGSKCGRVRGPFMEVLAGDDEGISGRYGVCQSQNQQLIMAHLHPQVSTIKRISKAIEF